MKILGILVQKMVEIVAENIDRLVSIEMRPKGLPRGTIRPLYEATRAHMGKPLTLCAAEGLQKHVTPKSTVIITTGVYLPQYVPKGETDGPPGAASLARALDLAFDAYPIILCEEQVVEATRATCAGIGLPSYGTEQVKRPPHSVLVKGFPVDEHHAEHEVERIFAETNPTAIISVEKLGKNAKGEYHSVTGVNITPYTAKVDVLFEKANSENIFTLGIGDGGNEIGFGTIYEAARPIVPNGVTCKCPCQGGIVTTTATTSLVTAATSNWGAYGVVACLSALLETPEILHDRASEERMLQLCAQAGAIDGVTSLQTPSVDGVSGVGSVHIVELLELLVKIGLVEIKRPF
jgi:hypothetical protein